MLDFPSVNIKKAYKKISSEQGKLYCIEKESYSHKICGKALLDSLLSALGNGYKDSNGDLNGLGGFVKSRLEMFLKSDPNNPKDENKIAFQNGADIGIKWFAEQRNLFIVSLLALELKSSANAIKDCNEVEERLKKININPSDLMINECRLIFATGSEKDLLKVEKDFKSLKKPPHPINRKHLYRLINKHSIPVHMIFGNQDTFSAWEFFQANLHNPMFQYTQLPHSGHAAYRESSALYEILLEPVNN